MSRDELQVALKLNDKGNFRRNYLNPALEAGLIERKNENILNSPTQKYRLTEMGIELKKKLKEEK